MVNNGQFFLGVKRNSFQSPRVFWQTLSKVPWCLRRPEWYCLLRHALTVYSFSMGFYNKWINSKLSESQLNTDFSRKRIGSCQSMMMMWTCLCFTVAFHFRKPVKAAHIKEALFYSIGFYIHENKKAFFFPFCKTMEVKQMQESILP